MTILPTVYLLSTGTASRMTVAKKVFREMLRLGTHQ
jgi:hypothetical protein